MNLGRIKPSLLWGIVALGLMLGALVLPGAWNFGSLGQGADVAYDAFHEEVARVDARLASGEPVEVSAETLQAMKPHLQVRRLLRAGPMTSDETRQAARLLEEFGLQEREQALEGSRQAVRNARDRRLAELFPRLDGERVKAELSTLRAQLEAAN